MCVYTNVLITDMFSGVDPVEEVFHKVHHFIDSRDIELRVSQHLSMSCVPLKHDNTHTSYAQAIGMHVQCFSTTIHLMHPNY